MSRVGINGARAVVTGAGRGIGAATALAFAEAGATVVAVDVDGDSARATAEACSAVGSLKADAYICDVADAEAVGMLAPEIEADHGPVDVLVNNAGVGLGGPFLESSIADWEWLRSINLDGVVHGCHAFGGPMVERGYGHVVNIASGAGYIANRNMAAYCATKAAVVMLSQCLRSDWAASDVGVSVICPGVIKTPILDHTRLVGEMASRRTNAERVFGFGHPPELVAKAVLGAVRKNHDIVPVGIESHLAFRLLRFAPGPIQGLVARAQVP